MERMNYPFPALLPALHLSSPPFSVLLGSLVLVHLYELCSLLRSCAIVSSFALCFPDAIYTTFERASQLQKQRRPNNL